jgi:hypothetical protein
VEFVNLRGLSSAASSAAALISTIPLISFAVRLTLRTVRVVFFAVPSARLNVRFARFATFFDFFLTAIHRPFPGQASIQTYVWLDEALDNYTLWAF